MSDSQWSDPLLYTTENLMHHDTVICLFRNKEVVNSHSKTHRGWRILLMKKAISNGRRGSCWFVLRCAFIWKQLRFLDETCKTFHKCVYLLLAYISGYCVSSKSSSMNEASFREKKDEVIVLLPTEKNSANNLHLLFDNFLHLLIRVYYISGNLEDQ